LSCNQKIGLKKEYAGKQVKCAKCKNTIQVPGQPIKPPIQQDQTEVLKAGYATEPETDQQKGPFDGLLNDVGALEDLQQAEANAQAVELPQKKDDGDGYKFTPSRPPPVPSEPVIIPSVLNDKTDSDKERKFPWPLDVFLYPASLSGVITIAFIVVLHLAHIFLGVIARLSCFTMIAWWIFGLAIAGYVFWYFCECVRSSAVGIIRAGSNWGDNMNLLPLLGCALKQIFFVLLFWSPVITYFLIFRRIDVFFWILAIAPWFLFPMALLAVIMFDSITGFNPFLWITSICSTFLPYLGVLLISICVLLLFIVAGFLTIIPFFFIFSDFFILWIMLVWAHLLGRFYYRYEEKLYWEA